MQTCFKHSFKNPLIDPSLLCGRAQVKLLSVFSPLSFLTMSLVEDHRLLSLWRMVPLVRASGREQTMILLFVTVEDDDICQAQFILMISFILLYGVGWGSLGAIVLERYQFIHQ